MDRRRVLRPRILAGLAGAAALLVGTLHPGDAFAGLTTCASDPMITLSNGQTLSITATVDDAASDVNAVRYVVHVPRGTSLESISYSGDVAADREYVRFFADQPEGMYFTSTTAYTGAKYVHVSATATIGEESVDTSGISGFAIPVFLHTD